MSSWGPNTWIWVFQHLNNMWELSLDVLMECSCVKWINQPGQFQFTTYIVLQLESLHVLLKSLHLNLGVSTSQQYVRVEPWCPCKMQLCGVSKPTLSISIYYLHCFATWTITRSPEDLTLESECFNISTICGSWALISLWNAAVQCEWVKHLGHFSFLTHTTVQVHPTHDSLHTKHANLSFSTFQ